MTKATLQGMGVFYFITLRSHSLTEGSCHRNLRNEMKLKSRRNAFYFLLIVARKSCFLVQPKTTCSGVTLPTVRWALPHLMIDLKNALTALPRGRSSGSIFSLKNLSSHTYLSLCQVDKNQSEQIYTGRLFYMSTISSCFNVSWCFCI